MRTEIDPDNDPIAYRIAMEMIFDPKYAELTAKELRDLIDQRVLEIKRDLLHEAFEDWRNKQRKKLEERDT